MRTGMFALSAGIVWVGFWPTVLAWQVFLSLAVLLLALLWHLRKVHSVFAQVLLVMALILLGACWHLVNADYRLGYRLPAELEGQDLLLRGYVASIPEQTPTGQRFRFMVENIGGENTQQEKSPAGLRVGSKILLNSYGIERFEAAEYWQLVVRLQKPHGSANPGTFDYEAWLFQQGISARGYVRTSGDNRSLSRTRSSLLFFRAKLRRRLVIATDGLPFQGVLLAVTLGDRDRLTDDQWEMFTQTGTNHLVVISGLHVVLVASLCAWLLQKAWRCSAWLMLLLPAQQAGAVVAIIGALIYSAVAGFALPTQRAVIMVVVFVLSRLLATKTSNWFSLQLAMLAVLMLDPLAATGSGFWLSFTAVAALLLVNNHQSGVRENLPGKASVSKFVVPQLAVFVGLLVPLGYWQGQVSLLAPLANVLAIPVVSWLVVPLCLLASIALLASGGGGQWLLALASQIFGWLYQLLERLIQFSGVSQGWQVNTVTDELLLIASVGTLLLLLPGYANSRLLGIMLLLPFLWQDARSRNERLLDIHVLDVGQGLSVIVSTASHTLVYDTGPRFSSGFDSGTAIVAPVLRAVGVDQIDVLMISHGDNDHAGGVEGLLASIPVQRVLAGEASEPQDNPVQPCVQNQGWRWDGVDFRVLHPAAGSRYQGNNSSCVLLVSVGEFELLLPGDIDASIERLLVSRLKLDTPLNVLLSAHHGSNTSSSYTLLASLTPRLVIHSAGYRNQFGHPTDTVRERFAQLGAQQLATASSGMITVSLSSETAQPEIRRHRRAFRRYWHWSEHGKSR